jgi:drug/metabolite transporter (DMT)-like permease
MSATPSTPRIDDPVPPARRRWDSPAGGMALAGVTAAVSGVSVFVNGYAVKQVPDATAYTTLKNLVAALLVVGLAVLAGARRSPAALIRPTTGRQRAGLLAVAVIGGSVPFVLFFEGLARASAKDAAFLHKTLVVWVAVGAVTVLHERIGWIQGAAVAALVAGQALLGVQLGAIGPGSGEVMILAATLLWAVEVVVARWLLRGVSPLTVATSRLGGGAVLLVAWCAVTGRLGSLVPGSGSAWGWVLLTGGLLAAYGVTWLAALARAQAVDVTAVLVAGAVLTAVLDGVVKGTALAPQVVGLVLISGAAAAVVVHAVRAGRRAPDGPPPDATPRRGVLAEAPPGAWEAAGS